MRDSCNYMLSASIAVLDAAAKRREEWLWDIYAMGRDAAREHANEAFVIRPDQWDPGTAVKLVNTLRLGAVDVERAAEPFSAGARQYPAGTFIIRGAQPFQAHAWDLLTPPRWVGLANYLNLTQDGLFQTSLRNTACPPPFPSIYRETELW